MGLEPVFPGWLSDIHSEQPKGYSADEYDHRKDDKQAPENAQHDHGLAQITGFARSHANTGRGELGTAVILALFLDSR